MSTAVSTGDKYDVSGNDMLLWWHGDERTRLAVLHLESFGNPRKFSRFARRLADRMPVLTVRSGGSTAGQRATASHTAATATPSVTRDALFRQAGVLAVDRLDELSELIATLSWQPAPTGKRTAVVTNAGGAGVLAADACEAHGLAVPPLSERTQRRLRRLLPRSAATANPVDTSAVVSPEVFGSPLSAVRADPDVDAVLAVTVATAVTDPFPGIAPGAAGDGTPVPAVRLGQAEHVTGLAAHGARGTVPVFADAAAAAGRSRRPPPARSGCRGPAALRGRSRAWTGCAPEASWRGSSRHDRKAGGWRPRRCRTCWRRSGCRCSRAPSSTGRTRPWPRSPQPVARSR